MPCPYHNKRRQRWGERPAAAAVPAPGADATALRPKPAARPKPSRAAGAPPLGQAKAAAKRPRPSSSEGWQERCQLFADLGKTGWDIHVDDDRAEVKAELPSSDEEGAGGADSSESSEVQGK